MDELAHLRIKDWRVTPLSSLACFKNVIQPPPLILQEAPCLCISIVCVVVDFPLDVPWDLSRVTPSPARHWFPKTLLLFPKGIGVTLACFPSTKTSLRLPEVVLEAWLGN